VKSDIAYGDSGPDRHAEGLNRAIEVFIVEGVLVVPNPSRGVSHLVTHEPDAIVSRIRLDLIYCRACTSPGHDSRLHSHGRAERRKREVSSAANAERPIGDVVIHVALPWMSLAPGVFMRANV